MFFVSNFPLRRHLTNDRGRKAVTEKQGSDRLDQAQLQLLSGAKRMLNTTVALWKMSLVALVGSLSAMGIIALLLYSFILPRDALFIEGIVFLAIAAWTLARSLTGQCCSCCTVEIPRWKRILGSFVKPDGTFDTERQGEGVVDTIMQMILASEDWISVIRREVLSMLIWPILAIGMLLLTVYTVEVTFVRAIVLAFVGYVFLLTFAIYFGVKLKFQSWQNKVDQFKTKIDRPFEII
jgi:hypothetical protein